MLNVKLIKKLIEAYVNEDFADNSFHLEHARTYFDTIKASDNNEAIPVRIEPLPTINEKEKANIF